MAQDKNLPEGTDKVIPGAAATVEEVVVIEAVIAEPPRRSGGGGGKRAVGREPTTGGASRGDEGGDSRSFRDKVRSGGEKLSGQAAGKARDLVGQGLERSGDALINVGKLVSDTATGLDERLGPEYGEYARRAAESIDNVAQSLRSKDPDELIDDTRTFVRKSPGVALAGAAIIGFALARLVKSGLDAGRGDEPGDGTDNNRGGGSGPA